MPDSDLHARIVRLEERVERNTSDINRLLKKLDSIEQKIDDIRLRVDNVIIVGAKAKTIGGMILIFCGFIGWLFSQSLDIVKTWGQ